MVRLFALAAVLFSPIAVAVEAFESAAKSEIEKVIHDELLGHYKVESVSMLASQDHTAEWGGHKNGYGLKTVTARFLAVRNVYWNEHLNREFAENCDQAGPLYVLCQPTGHEFSGKIEVDMAYTTDGWKVLSRNYRNRREFALSNYLLLVRGSIERRLRLATQTSVDTSSRSTSALCSLDLHSLTVNR